MKNKMFGILAGEDADLPASFINDHIHIYQFPVIWETVLKNKDDIYKKMREYKAKMSDSTPHTSQPSVGYFKELFEKYLTTYSELFVVTVSSKLSGCYNSAVKAVEMLEKNNKSKVHIIESPSTSTDSAFIVRKLVDLASHHSVKEILEEVNQSKKISKIVFMIEDSFWLQKGGRITPAIAMIINQMKKIGIRPFLGAKDGKISLMKVRTHVKDKVQGLYNYIESEVADKKADLIINHADNHKEAEILKNLFVKNKPNVNVLYTNMLSPVLGAHAGPDALVVGWKIKN
jgi:DegV family protein with EDD domain